QVGVVADGGGEVGVVEAVGDVELVAVDPGFEEGGQDLVAFLEGDEGDGVDVAFVDRPDDGAEIGGVGVVGLGDGDLGAVGAQFVLDGLEVAGTVIVGAGDDGDVLVAVVEDLLGEDGSGEEVAGSGAVEVAAVVDLGE